MNNECGVQSNHPRRLKVMMLSDVLPANQSGGELVLYRHLIESNDFDVLSDKPTQAKLFQSRFWMRWKQTRLFSLFNTIEDLLQNGSCESQVAKAAKEFNPDVVLTVAHGRGYHQAVSLARSLKRPLVTIYHDWWPDLNCPLPGFRWLGEWRFRWVARRSQVCLCVCDEMLEQIGCHEHSTILPPIPRPSMQIANQASTPNNEKFRIGYFGAMYEYGQMLESLAVESERHDEIRVEFRGNSPNWAPDRIRAFTDSGVLLPFARRGEFETWISSLDAILCVMTFEPRMRRRMETSFPSKLVDALQFGKPIIVWGPQYCSAVRWAKETGAAFCVTEECSQTALGKFRELGASFNQRRDLAIAAILLARSELSNETIQRKFVDELRNLVASHSPTSPEEVLRNPVNKSDSALNPVSGLSATVSHKYEKILA